ncbi:MAG: hypothetical protein H6719_28465, partial [Sandaracinaceae bacterium]|nr:hypothetical protein [Sandaracinaceae bacterium]
MRSFSIPLFASLLVAGCGVLFETRAEVVSYPRATALVRVESSAHGVEGVVTAAAPPVLPGFEARVPSAGGTVLRGTDSAGSVGAGGPGPWVATEPAESGTVAATPAERPATAPRDGVWSLDGRPASLAMLLDG